MSSGLALTAKAHSRVTHLPVIQRRFHGGNTAYFSPLNFSAGGEHPQPDLGV
jgi:hypothetical protein